MKAQIPILAFLNLLLPTLSLASSCRINPSIHFFRHGALRGTILSDGPIHLAGNPFLVPELALSRSYASAFRQISPILLSQNVAVLDVPQVGRLLVDAGSFGLQEFSFLKRGGRLLENLKAAGISAKSINAVLITHGHIDHVSGLRDADGGATFPNAAVYIGKTEHEFWSDPLAKPNSTSVPDETLEFISSIYLQAIEPYKGRLRLVKEDGHPFPGVRFIFGPGHSPGHNAIEITVGEKRLLITGDAWVTRPDQVQNPEWSFNVETNAVDAYLSRLNLLSLAAKRKDLVLSYHEQFPGLGFIAQSTHLFDWVPAPQRLGAGISLQC